MPTARELALDLRDEQRFLAEHDVPALVFDAPDADPNESRFDTPPQPFLTRGLGAALDGSATDVLAAVDYTATGLACEALRSDTRIEWLEKSARNPFAALITLGRTPNNDIIVSDPRVSKVHAIFTRTDAGWVVSDSHSSNGTFVDGLRLPSGEKRPLEDGAELGFGREVRARLVQPRSLYELLQLFVRRRRLP